MHIYQPAVQCRKCSKALMVLMVDCHRRVDHNPSEILFASQLSWDIEDIVTICKKMLETDTMAPLGCQTSLPDFSHDFPRIRSGFYRHFLKRDHCQHFFWCWKTILNVESILEESSFVGRIEFLFGWCCYMFIWSNYLLYIYQLRSRSSFDIQSHTELHWIPFSLFSSHQTM